MTYRLEALAYAKAGWSVIPIWWLTQEGRCGCGDPFCTAPGKHPLIKTGRGLEAASRDPKDVERWWQQWPDANIAVACGSTSGVVVIDCDIREEHDGYVELMGYLAERGIDLPDTLVHETGSGGRHIFLAYPTDGGSPIKNATAWLEDVDMKSNGGYVLVPPSTHLSGRVYRRLSAQGTPIATMTQELAQVLRGARSMAAANGLGADRPSYDYKEACKSGPRAGYRDHFFNARAFELRKSGVTQDDAVRDLRRLFELAEQTAGDQFTWEAVLEKMRRVWEGVEPDPIPDWNPYAALTGNGAAPVVGLVGAAPEDKLTDMGNAYRLVTRHGETLRFTAEGGWHVWNGRIWQEDRLEHAFELAKETARGLWTEALAVGDGDERERIMGWAKQSEARVRLEAMVRVSRTDPRVACSLLDMDKDPWVLTCGNGTLDLRTGTLREHRREDLVTKSTRVDYDPAARDVRWEAYITSTLGRDEELERYIQRAVGYTLTSSTREEALFMLYGPTASGKSTLITAVQTVLGDYAMTTMPENLMQRRGQGAPKDELARMRGMRLVASVEPSEGDKFAEGLIKQMTGGDKISARRLYRDGFDYDPTFKLWIATNTKPRGNDKALFRRIKLVPFIHGLERSEMDLTLKDYLRDPESNGARAVLAWAVQGCLDWQRDGLGTCAVVEAETREYEEQQDILGLFIAEVIEFTGDPLHSVLMMDLYSVYKTWCVKMGEKPMTYRSFNPKLEEHGVRVSRSRLKTADAVRLKPEYQPIEWQAGGV